MKLLNVVIIFFFNGFWSLVDRVGNLVQFCLHCKYSCNRCHHKQIRMSPLCDKPYLLEGSRYRYEKSNRERNTDLRVILILHIAVLSRNLENNKDMTDITNKYYLEEFNLIGPFNTNTGMFFYSSQLQPLKELQEFQEGSQSILITKMVRRRQESKRTDEARNFQPIINN